MIVTIMIVTIAHVTYHDLRSIQLWGGPFGIVVQGCNVRGREVENRRKW